MHTIMNYVTTSSRAITLFIVLVCLGCDGTRDTRPSQSAARGTASDGRSDSNAGPSSASEGDALDSGFMNKTWVIRGHIVDQSGKFVADYDAASIWSSNGQYWDNDGKVPMERRASIWKDEGILANNPQYSAERASDGAFHLPITDRPRAPVFAVNHARTHGGIVLVDRQTSDQSVKVKLTPLVKVEADLFCPEANQAPKWGKAYIYLANGDNVHLTSCGTYEGRICFWLPAGDYEISAVGEGPVSRMKIPEKPEDLPVHGVYSRGRPFSVSAAMDKLDLGVLALHLPEDSAGNPINTELLYGKPAPALSIADARGVPVDGTLEHFRGKWVLLDFWAMWCRPCVANSLPELTRFYSENADLHEHFEILAICNTTSEKISTIAEYEARIAAIRETSWNGEELPFPVLLDSEGVTYKSYGVASWPSTFLIDPTGRVVEGGDLDMLADLLRELRSAAD